MVTDSIGFGTDAMETLVLPSAEMDGLVKNYQELPQPCELPSAPLVPQNGIAMRLISNHKAWNSMEPFSWHGHFKDRL